jgi:hypothetical protein
MCTPYWYSRYRSTRPYYDDDDDDYDDYDDDYDKHNLGRRLSRRRRPLSQPLRPVSEAYIITPFVYNPHPGHAYQPAYPQAHPRRSSLPAHSPSASSSDSPSSLETNPLHFGPSYMRPQDPIYGYEPGMKHRDYAGREHDAAQMRTVDGHETHERVRRRHHDDQWKVPWPSRSDPNLSQLQRPLEHELRPQQERAVNLDRDALSTHSHPYSYSRPHSHHWHTNPHPTEEPQPSTSHGQSRKLQKRHSLAPKHMSFIPPPHESSPYVESVDQYSRPPMQQSYALQEIPSQPAPTPTAAAPTVTAPTDPARAPRHRSRREHRKSSSEPKPVKIAEPVSDNDPFDLRWPWLSSGPYEAIGRAMTVSVRLMTYLRILTGIVMQGNVAVEDKNVPKKRDNIPLGLKPGQVLRPGVHPGQVSMPVGLPTSASARPGPLIYQQVGSDLLYATTDSFGAPPEKKASSEQLQPQPPPYVHDQRHGDKSETVAYTSVLPSSKSASSLARSTDAGDYRVEKGRKNSSGSHPHPHDGAHQPRRGPTQPSTLVMPALLHAQSQPLLQPQTYSEKRTESYPQHYLPTQSHSTLSSQPQSYSSSQSGSHPQGSVPVSTPGQWNGYEQPHAQLPASSYPNLHVQPSVDSHTLETTHANVNPEAHGETDLVEPTVVWSQRRRNVLRKKRKEVASEGKVEIEQGGRGSWEGDQAVLEQQPEWEPERQGGRTQGVRRKLSKKKPETAYGP